MTIAKLKLKGLQLGKDYKMVIHYVQPYAPYIMFHKLTKIIARSSEISEEIVDIALRKLGKFCGKFSIDHIILGIIRNF